ncbi:hypothetical protein BC829DRAFT_417375 [Chytridium lagenaria]|nr:hypothetical protein BC829DRAFT_417375 [Chytridium lagenaria]
MTALSAIVPRPGMDPVTNLTPFVTPPQQNADGNDNGGDNGGGNGDALALARKELEDAAIIIRAHQDRIAALEREKLVPPPPVLYTPPSTLIDIGQFIRDTEVFSADPFTPSSALCLLFHALYEQPTWHICQRLGHLASHFSPGFLWPAPFLHVAIYTHALRTFRSEATEFLRSGDRELTPTWLRSRDGLFNRLTTLHDVGVDCLCLSAAQSSGWQTLLNRSLFRLADGEYLPLRNQLSAILSLLGWLVPNPNASLLAAAILQESRQLGNAVKITQTSSSRSYTL